MDIAEWPSYRIVEAHAVLDYSEDMERLAATFAHAKDGPP
jgi:hypothetical protein